MLSSEEMANRNMDSIFLAAFAIFFAHFAVKGFLTASAKSF
jgi:hypothetical protein